METAKLDNRKRLRLPQGKPGQVLEIVDNGDGSYTLIPLQRAEPSAPKARLAKEDGFTVVVPQQPINEQAIRDLLADFP
jgi:hypothetical protein